MNRGKQVVKKDVWYIGGKYRKRRKKRKQKGGAFPFGIIASLAGPVLGEVAKPLFKKILGRGKKRKKR